MEQLNAGPGNRFAIHIADNSTERRILCDAGEIRKE
jgi:hypothetical protein